MKHACLLILSLFAVLPAQAASAPDVDAALEQWKEAVETGTVDDVMALYDRGAIMISTFAQQPMTRREDIANYYKKVVVNADRHVEIGETHPRVFGEVAVNSGHYTLSYTQEGEPVSIPARFSFTYVLKGGRWVIVDHHSSRVPMAKAVK